MGSQSKSIVLDHLIDEELRLSVYREVINSTSMFQLVEILTAHEPELEVFLKDLKTNKFFNELRKIDSSLAPSDLGAEDSSKLRCINRLINNIFWAGVILVYTGMHQHWEDITGLSLIRTNMDRALIRAFQKGYLPDNYYLKAEEQLNSDLDPKIRQQLETAVTNHAKVKAEEIDLSLVKMLGLDVTTVFDKLTSQKVESTEDIDISGL